MRTSIQKARDYREKQNREQELPPLPEKPEDMRYGIIFLYAACCVSLMFLIITGDVHWVEASAAGNGIIRQILHTDIGVPSGISIFEQRELALYRGSGDAPGPHGIPCAVLYRHGI